MTYSYRPNRDECNAIIAALAKRYPACFFENPKLRRPLKNDILGDLYKDGVPFTAEETAAAVEWYKSHFSYRYAVQAGAKRVDLDGREAGTVTPAEQRAAELYIARRKQEKQDRDLPPAVRTTLALHRAGEVPDDALRKITVLPVATDRAVPRAQVDDGAVVDTVDLTSARSVVDTDKADRRDNTKKRSPKFSPPCPTCGATGHVIHTVQVEGGALIRTRRCLGEAPHIFQTKEISIAL
jgi:sRNA-binding protein